MAAMSASLSRSSSLLVSSFPEIASARHRMILEHYMLTTSCSWYVPPKLLNDSIDILRARRSDSPIIRCDYVWKSNLQCGPAGIGVDARYPNMNQTKHCWQNYVDYHKCILAKGEDFAPCRQFYLAYRSLCPSGWVCPISMHSISRGC